jgi:putative addiction module component (TIGR02574 family)
MRKGLLAEAAKLSVSDRIELVEAIWDTVRPDLQAVPLPESHRAELERRLADLDESPDAGRSWEEVRKLETAQEDKKDDD